MSKIENLIDELDILKEQNTELQNSVSKLTGRLLTVESTLQDLPGILREAAELHRAHGLYSDEVSLQRKAVDIENLQLL